MNKQIKSLIGCAALLSAMTACFPEQEVAPIDSPEDNTIATITPQEDYSTVKVGDIMYFDVTVDKMVRQEIDFSIEMMDNSEAGASNLEVISGTLPAYTQTTTVAVQVIDDHEYDMASETLAFRINANGDPGYNFQLSPSSDNEEVTVTLLNYEVAVDWSEATFEDAGLCDWGVDLDLLIESDENANYAGATAACPVEVGLLSTLPDGVYGLYVDFYDSALPEGSNLSIPVAVSISNNNGEAYQLQATFNSDNVGDETILVGAVEIANGVYTVLDADGNALGTM